jgi:hypothetical protein
LLSKNIKQIKKNDKYCKRKRRKQQTELNYFYINKQLNYYEKSLSTNVSARSGCGYFSHSLGQRERLAQRASNQLKG